MDSKRDFPIHIGERQFLLRYNFDALTAVEDLTGRSFYELITGLGTLRLNDVKTLFFAGIKKHHPDVKYEDVASILDDCVDFVALRTGLVVALENYFTKGKPLAAPEASVKKKVKREPSIMEMADSTIPS